MHNYRRIRSFPQKPSAHQGTGFLRQSLRTQKEPRKRAWTLITEGRNFASWTFPAGMLSSVMVGLFFTNARSQRRFAKKCLTAASHKTDRMTDKNIKNKQSLIQRLHELAEG